MGEFGVGIDIEDIARFKGLDFKDNKRFFNRIYTLKERKYCLQKSFSSAHFAVRFAGKEAIFKALNNFKKIEFPIDYKKIEIVNDKKGTPYVNVKEKRLRDLNIKISLSHTIDRAIALCVIVKK